MNTKSSPNISKFIPPRIFTACLVIGLLLDIVFFRPISSLFDLSVSIHLIGGFVIAMVSFGIMGLSYFGFKKRGISERTMDPASCLMTSGVYRFSRNPMYIGFVGILFGIGVMIASLPVMLSTLVLFAYLNFYVIPREETYLGSAFDEEYKAYCQKVRRWL